MKFRTTTAKDIEYMAEHSMSRGIQKHCPEQVNFTFTLEHKGNPLGIGGFILMNKTTAWCWVDMAPSAGTHLIITYRVIKEWIDLFAAEHELKRLQAYVECDFPEAIRMVEHLGFKRESTMENFIDDKPAFMYVKFME